MRSYSWRVFVPLALAAVLVGNGCAGSRLSRPPSAATRNCNAPMGQILYGCWERGGMFTANFGVGLPGLPGYDPCSRQWPAVNFERPPMAPTTGPCGS